MAVLAGAPLILKVGLAVAWLVGSWLFGPKQKKNKIIDPGAQEMPRWNTALRGITLPVLFGTNRVSSQLIWNHDYTVVRKETKEGGGGGGKMGGSGGGKGGGQAGGGSITYEYYWDLMFHLGMVPEQYELIKGWLGSQRINNEAMAAIIGGTAGSLVFADVNDPNQTEDKKITMKFQDSFYFRGSGPALGTDDALATNDGWSEIFSDMGLHARWPHTCYVGFKQLDLGAYPSVPQMSFEIGPGGGDIAYNNSMKLEDEVAVDAVYGGTPYITGTDGVIYAIVEAADASFGDVKIYSVVPSSDLWTYVRTYTSVQLGNTVLAYSTKLPDIGYCHIATLDPYNYISISGDGFTVAKAYNAIATIGSGGTITVIGCDTTWNIQLAASPNFNKLVAIANNRTLSDPIIQVYNGIAFGTHEPKMRIWPSISATIGADLLHDTPMPFYWSQGEFSRCDVLASLLGNSFGHDGSFRTANRTWRGYWWSVPKAETTITGVEYRTRLYYYVGPGEINGRTIGQNIYVDGLAATYPSGWIGYVDFGVLSFPELALPTWPVAVTEQINNLTDLDTGDSVFPFTDANLYADGTTHDSNYYGDYDPHPYCHKITTGANAGVYILIWAQNLPENQGVVDYMSGTAYTSWMRGRLMYWNMLDGTYTQLRTVEFSPYNIVADLGAVAGADNVPAATMLPLIYESSKLYYIAAVTDPTANALIETVFGVVGTVTITGGSDVTPPYIIYQILTSDIFGIGLTASMIDQTSYLDAVSYCVANEFYISAQYRREEAVLQTIDDLLSCYGGFLVISNGVVKFKQLEFLDGAANSLRTIDNNHFIVDDEKPPVTISKGARQDTFNKVRVNYFDRALEYAQNQVEEADEVDQDLNGIRPREFPPMYVMQEKMARTMATRALWANLYARDTYSFTLGWKDCDLEPGDVITLVDSFHTSLQGGQICRIIEWKESDRGRFEITAKQEFEYVAASSASALNITSASIQNTIGEIPTIKDFTMYELPAEYQNDTGMAYVSWAAYGFAAGAQLWLSTDGVSYASVQQQEPYQINMLLVGGLPNSDLLAENVEVYIAPRSDWATTNSYYYAQTLVAADQPSRAVGASLLWCGSEMMAYQGVNLVGQNHYRFDKLYRGWGGTNIHSHSSGDLMYKQGGGMFYEEISTDRIGTVIMYKVQPYNLAHAAQDISSISAKSYTIVGQNYLPQAPSAIQFNNNGRRNQEYVASTIDIPINWHASARKSGYGSKGEGKTPYGDFTPDSVSYRVEIVGSSNLVVRSEAVSVTSYTYTSSKNFADNGAWRGNVAVKVTPYNSAGLATQTSVISLDLWT